MAYRAGARLTPSEGRRFAFQVGAAFLVLAAITWWRAHPTLTMIFAAIGGSLGVAGFTIPTRLGGVYRAWMGFGQALSKVTTPIFMGIVYFVAITPIGLLMRAIGHNPIRHAEVDDGFWQPTSDRRGGMENQF